MKLELEEGDIREIAERRYNKKVGKSFWVILLSSLITLVILVLALPEGYDTLAAIPLIIFFVLWVRHNILMARFARVMIEDWRQEIAQAHGSLPNEAAKGH